MERITAIGKLLLGQCNCRQFGNFAKKNLLLILLVVALVVGIGLGAGLRAVEPPLTKRQIMYLTFPGDMLMNMLTFLIVPLIISSLISGLSSLDTRTSGKICIRAIVYYLTTTVAAIVVGIVLSVIIQPGTRGGPPDIGHAVFEKTVVNSLDTFLDLIRQCFPANIVEMCFRKTLTREVKNMSAVIGPSTSKAPTSPAPATPVSSSDTHHNAIIQDQGDSSAPVYYPVVTKVDGVNVLGIVVFSIFFGVVIGRMRERGRPLVELFQSICEATMQLVKLAIWYSPIGITFLIAGKVVETEDLGQTFQQLVYYFLTVMAGLAIHGLVTLPLIYFVIVRRNPYKYISGLTEAVVMALATSSSSAAMPSTMRCLQDNNGIDEQIVKFVIPVGATINMDGTALYEAVAVLFIGQMRGEEMGIGRIITISLTATAAAIGAAGVPQAGLVTMVIVLSAVGFPTDDVALILTVDWLLDRFRTTVNVLGDAFGAGIVNHLSGEEIGYLEPTPSRAPPKPDSTQEAVDECNSLLSENNHLYSEISYSAICNSAYDEAGS